MLYCRVRFWRSCLSVGLSSVADGMAMALCPAESSAQQSEGPSAM